MIELEKNRRLTALKGIIIPVDWDQKGNPISVAIATYTEEQYLVSNNSKGKELFDFIRERVEITGLVKEIAGIKIIKVKDIARCKFNNSFGPNDLTGKK
ncbi:MAG: hypothetical protein GTN73_02560 [Candidatus Aminicenantes bacterium]|nr:hypothetical protein [Candidatus Aminicenantes bacterium]